MEEIKQVPLDPTTTHQEDLVVAGQRKVNLIWEITQAVIALVVVGANMWVAVFQGLSSVSNFVMPPILSNSLFLVIGFYFSRTNHTGIGGIGAKPTDSQTYVGR